MIQIYICDDQGKALDHYNQLIRSIALKNGFEVSIREFISGEALLGVLARNPNQADIIYLDIVMHELNGLDLGKKLREMKCESEIIYLTNSKEYVFDAYDVNPVNYLMKNETSEAKFEQVLLKAIRNLKNVEEEYFSVDSSGNHYLIPYKDIRYFEIWRRIVTVYYESNKTLSFYSSMDELEEMVKNHGFVRTHRSFIVNLKEIKAFKKNTIIISSGDVIPVGVTYSKKLRDSLVNTFSGGSD